ncbi:hypothetical protein NLG97_g1345 [Lecanicillium saksenae]|uniref:Uncharacterized protein n=1 Tax=Lecanicillium saksenae TaxID=468837 RepID=A0ACC1R409_9HYPO|nr:hypothetical protein NLG97_g1345 [Lecanicillium saksenae]
MIYLEESSPLDPSTGLNGTTMKFRTKEEEQAQFNAVLKGALIGGAVGLLAGVGSMYAAAIRYPIFRGLRLQTKGFVLTSTTSFGAIFYAEQLQNRLHATLDPMRTYKDSSERAAQSSKEHQNRHERFQEWCRTNRYSIVGASWLASMVAALAMVSRSPASTAQKLVQARVYAQGLTLAVLIATAAFEVNDAQKGVSRWETVKIIDPSDPEHKRLIEKKVHKEEYSGQDLWMDMVAAEERRIAGKASTPTNDRPK